MIPVDQIAKPAAYDSWNPEVGDSIVGTITFADIMAPKPNFDGDKLEQEMRVDLVDDDGQKTTIWAVVNTDVEGDGYPSRLARAISNAVRDANAPGIELGGKLAGSRIADVPPTKPGRKPAKDYDFAYRPPAVSVPAAKLQTTEAAQPAVQGDSVAPQQAAPTAADLLGGDQ